MRHYASRLITIFLALLLLSGPCLAGETLRVGRVSSNPKKHFVRVKSFADYLVAHLAGLGYTDSKVVFAKDSRQMAELMQQGKVDLLSETAYAAAHLSRNCGAEILLREWRDGASSYRSVLLKRKDSRIASIADLEGRVVAFEDPSSTSAYYLPSLEIERAGLTLVEKKFPTQPMELGPGQVGYVFARQEINVALWVQEGLVDAGALSDLDMADADNVPETVLPHLDVFHRSSPYPRSLLLVRGSLPEPVKDAIRTTLLHADETPDGVLILDKYKKVSKYDRMPEEEAQTLETIRLK